MTTPRATMVAGYELLRVPKFPFGVCLLVICVVYPELNPTILQSACLFSTCVLTATTKNGAQNKTISRPKNDLSYIIIAIPLIINFFTGLIT